MATKPGELHAPLMEPEPALDLSAATSAPDKMIREGELLDSSAFAARLGWTEHALGKALAARRVFDIEHRGAKYFPAFFADKRYDLRQLEARADRYDGTLVVRSALQLTPMLMVRPGELRLARWEEFDLDNGLWVVPSLRLKRRKNEKLWGKSHLVHLPRQATQILEELFIETGQTGYLFAGSGHKNACISNSTVNAALRRMGYCTKTEVTGHGFRATFRTLVVELLGFPEAIAEMQLAHAVKDQNGSAYNRAEFLNQRRALMQAWADYLEDLRHDRAKISHPLLTEFTPVTLRRAAPRTEPFVQDPASADGDYRVLAPVGPALSAD